MTQAAMQHVALNVSAATTDLITRIFARFPQAQIRSRSTPLSDEDISIDVVLPMSMEEIYQVREWLYDLVIELQERYDLLIQVSAVPQEGYVSINP
jgi:hypothetical protein